MASAIRRGTRQLHEPFDGFTLVVLGQVQKLVHHIGRQIDRVSDGI
jgi:hypothetical protein